MTEPVVLVQFRVEATSLTSQHRGDPKARQPRISHPLQMASPHRTAPISNQPRRSAAWRVDYEKAVSRGGDWITNPDWVGIDVSGTWLAPLAPFFPPLAVLSLGGQLVVDRYGDAYIGPQVGISVPGALAVADAGWVWESTIPSHSYLNTFISGFSVSGQVAAAAGIAVSGSIIYGNAGHWGTSAFGFQVGIGYAGGHTASAQASWMFGIGGIGVKW